MKNLLTVVFGMFLWQSSYAVTLKGVEIPESINLSNGIEMKLQGAAVRNFYFVVDGYIGSLYLENPTSDVDSILADESYKRMAFTVLRPKLSARKIGNAFTESLQINTSAEEQEELNDEINQFLSAIDGTLRKGEAGALEYIPGKGTKIIIAGENRGIIPGKAFFNAILKVWIGEIPPSKHFKAGILGLAKADTQ